MKNTILVDISVIVEYLKTGKGVLPAAYEKFTMAIVATTYTELLASVTFKDANLEKEVQEFIKKYFTVLELDEAIGIKASEILRNNDLTLAAAAVVASALHKNVPLLTNEKKAYEKIEGLTFAEI